MDGRRGKSVLSVLAACLYIAVIAPRVGLADELRPPGADAVQPPDEPTSTLSPFRHKSFEDKLLEQVLSVRMHGFVSQGYLLSSGNNYLAATSKRGSFEYNEVGLNVTVPLSDRLRLGVQFFGQDLGPIGNYTARLDWFYLDYRWKDWLGLRFGAIKIPFGLYNDSQDVDAARNAALLPQSVYPATDRNLFHAQTGMEVYGFIDLRHGGGLDYRAFLGTIFVDTATTASPDTTVLTLTVPYVAGGRLLWETPLTGLRLGGSVLATRFESTVLLGESTTPTAQNLDAFLAIASAEYISGDFNLAAEYSRWLLAFTAPGLNQHQTSERAYVMSSYRLTNWFQPGAYYSLYYPDIINGNRSGPSAQQQDAAATLRFDLATNWLVKIEGHYMYGTAAVLSSENANSLTPFLPRGSLAPSWGLLVLKTTAYF